MGGILHGLDVATGVPMRVEFDDAILEVAPSDHAGDVYLAPGWIDLQVNGFAGVDYNQPRVAADDVERSLQAMFECGVTRCLPTVITGPSDDMRSALERLADAKESLPSGRAIEGLHVEGPHISPEDGPRGAHPRQWVRAPDVDEFRRWQDSARGHIALVTLSPEWPQAIAYIEALTAHGVVVSIGHTRATSTQIADAVSAGATMSTHLGNAADSILPRHANYIWDQLADDRLSASFIVDGIHLPRPFLKAALRAKGVERSVLVTDASAPAGASPGRYSLGEQPVDLTSDGRVVLAGQDRLAGSALRMDRGVQNLMTLAGLSLADAVAMATTNPARVAKIAGRSRGLVRGDRADFVLFQCDPKGSTIDVRATYVGGECVFSR